MKLTKQKLKQIIKEELKQHEFEDFMENEFEESGPLTRDVFKNYLGSRIAESGGMPSIEKVREWYYGLKSLLDPEDRSHMSEQKLKQIIKEELNEKKYRLGPFSLETERADILSLLTPIFDDIENTYGRIGQSDDQQEFERILVDQINEYRETWQRQRKAAAE